MEEREREGKIEGARKGKREGETLSTRWIRSRRCRD